MENVEVFDNHREAVKTLNSIKSYNSYLCHFKLQFVKANNDKQHGAIYMAFHCIHSSIPLSEIQKQEAIRSLLTKVSARMTVHQWSEDETNISNFDFFWNQPQQLL